MTEPTELVIASGNPGKLREFSTLLGSRHIHVRPQADFHVVDVEEVGATFVENALLKAREACRVSGRPALADDSGLAVDALGGRPGIHSARFAGEPKDDQRNNHKLLEQLQEVPEGSRGASYWCVLVLLRHAEDPVPLVVQQQWRGEILAYPRGTKGFGYDPLFWVPECGMTVAELSPVEKNRLSHRGRALEALLRMLDEGGL